MAEQRDQRQQQEGPMADLRAQFGPQYGQQEQPRCRQVVKAATAVTAGGSFLVLSGLTLAATVIGLTVATPVLVIFSPVLVPAVITVGLLMAGFLTSGALGAAAVTVLSWIYRYVTGKHPLGAEQLDQASYKLSGKARDMRDRAEQQFGQQQQHFRSGVQAS
ncbi:oleosin 1-like [Telopea speciosissima]|uniref:oleosin 1-like n=1 Tax=Telopea speciosissima TaxID=54955 RepID=UPI001CC4D6D9|nr:oleosin 1-like [Telopea speciosissima]